MCVCACVCVCVCVCVLDLSRYGDEQQFNRTGQMVYVSVTVSLPDLSVLSLCLCVSTSANEHTNTLCTPAPKTELILW